MSAARQMTAAELAEAQKLARVNKPAASIAAVLRPGRAGS